MAADAKSPAPSKTAKRLNAAGKLTALLGLPLLLIGTIVGGGVYCGATRSYRIQTLEARYLGFQAPGGAVWAPPQARAEPSPDAQDTPEDSGGGEPKTTGGDSPEPATPDPATPDPATPDPTSPEPTSPEPTTAEPASPTLADGLRVVVAAPVGDELRALFDKSLVVHVKLMVDPALAAAREDWLPYASELFAATHESFSTLFGIELRLQGIMLWNAAQGSPPELLADLETREREGAEVIIGLVASATPPGHEAQSWTGEFHGDHGLVFADLEHDDRYYQNMLRTLAVLLGAQTSSEASAVEQGSFMSAAGSPKGQAPVLDPTTRGQIIMHKDRPFVVRDGEPAEPEPEPTPDDPPAPPAPADTGGSTQDQ